MGLRMLEEIAREIWLKRPDCIGKPWPLENATEKERRTLNHHPIAALDLCFTYAKAALSVMEKKSAPAAGASHNSGERDPSVMPDYSGADTKELREALEAAKEYFELVDADGERAILFNDGLGAPEDTEVRDLCERIGYGAVMDSAARQWFLKDNVGAFVIGSAAILARSVKAKVFATLKAAGEKAS